MKKVLLSLSGLLLTAHLSHAAAPRQEDSMSRDGHESHSSDSEAEMVPLVQMTAASRKNAYEAKNPEQNLQNNNPALQQDRVECNYLASLVQQRTALLCEEKPAISALPVAEREQRLDALNEEIRKIDQRMAAVLAINIQSPQVSLATINASNTTQSNRTSQQGLINCMCCLSCCF